LTAQKLRLTSRPATGVSIVLKRVINDNGTADNCPANGILCSAILESACKAARVIGARLAGVDLICSDPSIPLEHSGGAIIEVNVNPGLYYHYSSERTTYPVTKEILNRFFHNTLSSSVGQIND
jgi:cyanophycin synthetase